MIDVLLSEAWINKAHKVFGRKLKPYCLWHEFLLLSSENPLFCESSEETNLSHLEVAVRICSTRYPRIPSFKVNLTRLALRAIRRNLKAEMIKFETYIRDFNSGPDFWHKDEGPSNKGAPPGTILTISACMALGFQEEDAWNLPTGKALWYSACHQFDKGAELDFVTERSRRMMSDLKERLKEADGKTN